MNSGTLFTTVDDSRWDVFPKTPRTRPLHTLSAKPHNKTNHIPYRYRSRTSDTLIELQYPFCCKERASVVAFMKPKVLP